jgi:hypothetical protein
MAGQSKEVKVKEIDTEEQMRINFYDKGRDDTMSFAQYVKSGMAKRDMSNSKGGAKMPKKHIMELPTNRPRLKGGAMIADINNNGKIEGWEQARSDAIQRNQKKSASS